MVLWGSLLLPFKVQDGESVVQVVSYPSYSSLICPRPVSLDMLLTYRCGGLGGPHTFNCSLMVHRLHQRRRHYCYQRSSSHQRTEREALSLLQRGGDEHGARQHRLVRQGSNHSRSGVAGEHLPRVDGRPDRC